MRKLTVLVQLLIVQHCFGQGINSVWLLGNQWNPSIPKARMIFNTSSYQLNQELRKMPFDGTQATLSDQNGNFLMSSNGVWIANALNDTMQNGSGLNPSWDVNAHPNGLLIKYGNVFIPFPGDSNKYVLFHHAEFDPDPFSYFGGIHKSVIDITQDGGLGAVIQKNDTLIQDQFTWGLAACKHANGRDWWVIAQKDSSDIVYKILLTPNGVESITTQNLGYSFFYKGNAAQITFSQDGTKFIQCNYFYVGSNHNDYFIISDFDRCTGIFSNTQTILIATNSFLFGLAFSPSGKYAYTCTSNSVYQIDTDNMTWQIVANYDGFISGMPPNCCPTSFFNMYLAANGKIYITSGSSVQHIHEMNYPDSAGTACDVQQHNINLGIWNFRSVPNHPNYYLGPVTGSVCDTLGVGIAEQGKHDFRFSILPNPNSGSFQILYLLPPDKSGVFSVYDINGRKVYEQKLPQWSTVQSINLMSGGRHAPVTLKGSNAPIADGIYQCVITSGNERVVKKVAIIKE